MNTTSQKHALLVDTIDMAGLPSENVLSIPYPLHYDEPIYTGKGHLKHRGMMKSETLMCVYLQWPLRNPSAELLDGRTTFECRAVRLYV